MTVCEAIASCIGKFDALRDFERATTREEITRGREAMVEWYRGMSEDELLAPVREIPLAPGARDALAQCKAQGVTTVLLTITWTFAADYFAKTLGFDYYAGTALHADGTLSHFWPEDKAAWISAHCAEHDLPQQDTAAVGDSWGDAPMLQCVHRGVYVGANAPPVPGVLHRPNGCLADIVRELLAPQAQ